ncbi:unnamed protein product [Clonostachys chloroleuca]|uniref:Zn(2)-C6 fungal-type domain-containing protein n=1 Tax=Clonostachys chloroleuca TaxID=1926264 RepID=A0AA35Q0D0_9HYPO|nr:unnamed protein product [Clonostachys chloroleuca]
MEDSPRPKQAACLVCRRSKIKCDWKQNEDRCHRCVQLDVECIRPVFVPGRQKGIKKQVSKRVGLDKALFQIDEAVKRARSGSQTNNDDQRVLAHLQQLLGQLTDADDTNSTHVPLGPGSASSSRIEHDTAMDRMTEGDHSDEEDAGNAAGVPEIIQQTEDSLAIDDAENPLQLLARASYNIQPSPDSRHGKSPQSVLASVSSKDQQQTEDELQAFFAPARAKLDIGGDYDPISLGLVSEEEAQMLFTYFHENLAHTRWGFDPRLYTAEFARSRSTFLFTSVMAASALFIPSGEGLSRRLSNHTKKLAHRVIECRFKSVEIVLAFLVNIPWMFPGKQSTDDETCTYMSLATTIATDLSLHKKVVSPEMFDPIIDAGLARADCLDPRSALVIDGFPNVNPRSERGRLLLRSRERCWIALFVLERGMSLARGRPFSVPITRSLKDCDNWHRSDLRDPQDGPLVSMAVLRRDLDGLFSAVRALCDSSRNPTSNGALVAQSIEGAIERFFDQWFTEWGNSIGRGPDRRLPPYVEILVVHTRLSIYGGVINHPTAHLEVRSFFRTAGLSSALNVMRVAIQGESQLRSMPNNTAIMISFAACFALMLSSHASGGSALAPSIRNLIEEAASVLIRTGRVTNHRNGLSVLHGKYLQQLSRRAAPAGNNNIANMDNIATSLSSTAPHLQDPMALQAQGNDMLGDQSLWSETFQFSAMSNDEIQQVLNQPGNDLDPTFGGLSWEDMSNFQWLFWPEVGI